jgi:hypothetical protein
MSENAVPAAGYHVIWGTSYIGEVITPKIPGEKLNMIDNTTHDALAANGGVETSSPGTITQNDGSVKIYYIGSTVHKALRTDFKAKTQREAWFIRPNSGGLIGTARKCTAVISSMEEPIDAKGEVIWEMNITPVTSITDVETPATGLTTFVISDDKSPTPNVITPVPAAAAAVYAYEIQLYSDDATFTVTPTFSAGTCYINGNSTPTLTGVASTAITAPVQGKALYVPILFFETNKTPKPYLLHVTKGNVTKP